MLCQFYILSPRPRNRDKTSQEGVSLTQVAKDLGLDARMLRRRRKEAGVQRPQDFRGDGYAHDEGVAKLKRE